MINKSFSVHQKWWVCLCRSSWGPTTALQSQGEGCRSYTGSELRLFLTGRKVQLHLLPQFNFCWPWHFTLSQFSLFVCASAAFMFVWVLGFCTACSISFSLHVQFMVFQNQWPSFMTLTLKPLQLLWLLEIWNPPTLIQHPTCRS